MKGVILAGGLGTRLLPLTRRTNKHLLPVGGRAMIEWPLGKLFEAGVERVLVVSSADGVAQIRDRLGNRVDYRVQAEPRGVADAIAQAAEFSEGDAVVVVLGDNLFEAPLAPLLERWSDHERDGFVLLSRVSDPERFGIARLEADRIVEIREKPERPASDLAVTGIYFYPGDFPDRIAALEPSPRGELEVSALNQAYLDDGRLKYAMLDGFWIDAGTLEDYERADRWFLAHGS
jgi:glucose-1-phosphate thymidylyltransferase